MLGLTTLLAVPPQPKPNVVLIFFDDLGFHELGAQGLQNVKTPNMDRLVRTGTSFTRFYTSCPVCAPARAGLMTGKHNGRSPIRGNKEVGGWELNTGEGNFPLPPQETTLAERFRSVGYATGMAGKWGLGAPGTESTPNKQGFDYFFGYLCQRQAHNLYPAYLWQNSDVFLLTGNPYFRVHSRLTPEQATPEAFSRFIGRQYAPALMTEKAVSWIKGVKNQPFFMYFASPLPHVALQAPKETVDLFPREWDSKPYLGEGGYCPSERPRATYAAMLTELDRSVGALIKAVEDKGQLENTLFILTSDNGTTFVKQVDSGFFGSLGSLRGAKSSLYEGGIKVPFIASWPGKIPAGRQVDQVSYLPDLTPTLGALAGFKAGRTDGIDLSSVILGAPKTKPRSLYFEYPEGPSWQGAIFDDRFKVLRQGMARNEAKMEVYDLFSDPSEKTDIADLRPDLVKRALTFFAKSRVPNKDFPLPGVDTPPVTVPAK